MEGPVRRLMVGALGFSGLRDAFDVAGQSRMSVKCDDGRSVFALTSSICILILACRLHATKSKKSRYLCRQSSVSRTYVNLSRALHCTKRAHRLITFTRTVQ